jgi:hypothetical protein
MSINDTIFTIPFILTQFDSFDWFSSEVTPPLFNVLTTQASPTSVVLHSLIIVLSNCAIFKARFTHIFPHIYILQRKIFACVAFFSLSNKFLMHILHVVNACILHIRCIQISVYDRSRQKFLLYDNGSVKWPLFIVTVNYWCKNEFDFKFKC